MPREAVEAKAARYLAEGRLFVERADAHGIQASCRGQGAVYRLGWDGHDWTCTCPAFGRCAHLVALWRVVVPHRDHA